MATPAESERQIRQVVANYCRGVDRRDWALVRDCYHDDAVEDHGIFTGGPDDFVAWLAERHADGAPCVHFLGSPLVVLAGDAAFVESYAVSIQATPLPDGRDGSAVGGCRYIDRFERRLGRWRIASRTMTVEFMRPPVAAAPVPDVFTASLRSADDVSYAVLASVLGP